MKAAGTYLAKILERTKADLPARKKAKAEPLLRTFAKSAPKTPGFEQTLRRTPPARIIAELKRKSPSKGFLDRDLDVTKTAKEYEAGGAAALSVLTEPAFFNGALEDLSRARAGCRLPLLRKDFIIDPYQIVEAKVGGASAVLLIVAALEDKELRDFLKLAREFDLDALVEVHDEAEMDRALDLGAPVVGINNRDLRTFEVDLGITERLAPKAAKAGALVVAESGIETPDDIRRLAKAGADAFLVGESLIRSAYRADAVKALVEAGRG